MYGENIRVNIRVNSFRAMLISVIDSLSIFLSLIHLFVYKMIIVISENPWWLHIACFVSPTVQTWRYSINDDNKNKKELKGYFGNLILHFHKVASSFISYYAYPHCLANICFPNSMPQFVISSILSKGKVGIILYFPVFTNLMKKTKTINVSQCFSSSPPCLWHSAPSPFALTEKNTILNVNFFLKGSANVTRTEEIVRLLVSNTYLVL